MRYSLVFIILFIPNFIYSQNLVSNGSFEEYIELPYDISQIEKCYNWRSICLTPDYFHEKYNHSKTKYYSTRRKFLQKYSKNNLSIPSNNFGEQFARTGIAFAGVAITNDYREILSTKINFTLIKNHYYKIDYYVSLAELSEYYMNDLGAYFYQKKIKYWNRNEVIKIESDIRNTDRKMLNSYDEWMKVSGIYKAKGGEQYLSIGYFGPFVAEDWQKTNGKKVKDKHKNKVRAYYYIDDVSLYEVDSLGNLIYADTTQVANLGTITHSFDTLAVGQSFILEQISFDYNKSELLAPSFEFLDELVLYMQQKLSVRIEINGFTDNTGTEEANKQLSLNRAKAVFEYLMQNGISQDRIQYQGYGSKNPIADNNTEAGRQKNRRVEIKISEK